MLAAGVLVADDERRAFAAFVRNLVMPLPRDRRDGRAELQVGSDLRKRSERREIVPHDLSAGRQAVGVGRLPA